FGASSEFCCVVTAESESLKATQVVYQKICLVSSAGPCFPSRPVAVARHDAGNVQTEVSQATFHALQSLMKETAAGQRLVNLYWQHTSEVVGIVFANPQLLDQTISLLRTFQPGVSALLSGKGREVLITQPMITQLNVIW